MNWTEIELAELRRAYASGTLRVSYDGQRVEHGPATGRPKPRRSFAAFNKG